MISALPESERAMHRVHVVFAAVFVAVLSGSGRVADAAPADGTQRPVVATVASQPEGQTYGRWAAEWWQWVLGIPAATNPLFDATGDNCAQRQVDKVWFLAGSTSSAPVFRTCSIPADRALFFPLINSGYGAFLNDPPSTRTEAFVRAQVACTTPVSIGASIDGFAVPSPERFSTGADGSQSPIFNVQLPPANLFGADEGAIPELVLTPTAERGYYLFVRPLTPGTHMIRWIASGCFGDFSQDVTYSLKVKGQ
jgi:hypothetical protein